MLTENLYDVKNIAALTCQTQRLSLFNYQVHFPVIFLVHNFNRSGLIKTCKKKKKSVKTSLKHYLKIQKNRMKIQSFTVHKFNLFTPVSFKQICSQCKDKNTCPYTNKCTHTQKKFKLMQDIKRSISSVLIK